MTTTSTTSPNPTEQARLRLGSAIMALAGIGFVGYGVIFFVRNFTDSFLELGIGPDQALLGIVQGGLDHQLRAESAAGLVAQGFFGYAIGGLSVGESPEEMLAGVEMTVPLLPAEIVRLEGLTDTAKSGVVDAAGVTVKHVLARV